MDKGAWEDSDRELSVGRVVEVSSLCELSDEIVLLEGGSCSFEVAPAPCSSSSVDSSGKSLNSDSVSVNGLGILDKISGVSFALDPGWFSASITSLRIFLRAFVCLARSFFPSVRGVIGFGLTETLELLLDPGGFSS